MCTAVGCRSNSKTSKELSISLHWLPQEETLKMVWKQKLRWEKLPADENIRVWNSYFEEEYFERDLQVQNMYDSFHKTTMKLLWKRAKIFWQFAYTYRSKQWELFHKKYVLHLCSRIFRYSGIHLLVQLKARDRWNP